MIAIDISRRNGLEAAVRRFARECTGAVAVEWVITAAILAVAIVAGMSMLSGAVTDLLQTVVDQIGS